MGNRAKLKLRSTVEINNKEFEIKRDLHYHYFIRFLLDGEPVTSWKRWGKKNIVKYLLYVKVWKGRKEPHDSK